MKQQIRYLNLENNEIDLITFESNHECPRCKTPIVPRSIYGVAYKKDFGYFTALHICTKCSMPYLATYRAEITNSFVRPTHFLYSEPSEFCAHNFDSQIENVSPKFVEIYNQSLNAESMGLDQIAGIGYRKSVEFLIKDFAVFLHPENKDEIIAFPLAKCIQNYVDSHIIKNLAQKCTWLGNDEAHYIKKHTDRDINDLKKLIDATVHFISMFLIAKDAETISPA